MKLFCAIVFFFFASAGSLVNGDSDDAKYFRNLIESNIGAAEKYQFPVRNEEFKAEHDGVQDYGSYDFIIVGAGSAGSVLASRLTENPDFSVLLLEAGGEETDFSDIPAMAGYLQFSPMNWGYYTTPQNNSCLGMKNRQCRYPRGKVLGGSSTINALIFTRGTPQDYDHWEALGNPGWSFKDVLPYFLKSENCEVLNKNQELRGTGGPLNIANPLPPFPAFQTFIEGNRQLGQNIVDYNGRQQLGVSLVQSTIKGGRRQSTGKAFLAGSRKRSNLKVVTGALATKIEFGSGGKVAEGVRFVKDHQVFRAAASKEVVVSAGAINTPQLLMLSGIGPKEELSTHNITVVEDLPVGRDLQDHIHFGGLVFRTNCTTTADFAKEVNMYARDGKGPLTFAMLSDGIGFVKLSNTTDSIVEYILTPPNGHSSDILTKLMNVDEDTSSSFYSKINPSTDLIFNLVLSHPRSKGSVTLKSANPLDFPNVDLNFFSDPRDLENLYNGVRFILEVSRTASFRRINATLLDFGFCEKHEKGSRDFWYCAIRHLSSSLFHPIRTTQMGGDRKRSVVNHLCEVHGVGRLRVVDAGVMPATITGHTNAPTIMIAEKISDEIKRNYS